MSESQFPPSSPLLAAPDQSGPFESPLRNKTSYHLPKQTDSCRGRDLYPTPNPSSTVGRSSSPQRHEDDVGAESIATKSPKSSQPAALTAASSSAPRKVSINKDFNIINPHASVLRVPLVTSPFTIGRSSRSCDVHLNRDGEVDRSISRVHLRLSHSDTSMSLSCIGYNGFGIIVPRVCHVNKSPESTESNSVYELRETGKPLVATNVSKTIHLDYQHTEFHVARGETVKMPRFPNVLVQIASSVLLINPDDCDEELTDDEGPEKNCPALATPSVASPAPKTPTKTRPLENTLRLDSTPSRVTKKPLGQQSVNLPQKKRNKQKALENQRIFEHQLILERAISDKRRVSERQKCPEKQGVPEQPKIAQKEHSLEVQPAPSVAVERRARSEEPPLKKAKKEKAVHDAHGKLIIDHESIKGLQNVSEIVNILINHLAFSRLSSTPASVLNTISVAVTELSLPQLRAILHNISCIGVIYRQGKDAAGKPLEEEYYYMPENDHDPERNSLVSSIRGHGGLRACRRTHKQYYWKKPAPLK